MAAGGTIKRRQYYIDKRFQTRFILKFLLVLILGGVLSVIITLLTTTSTLTSSYDGARLVIEKTSLAILPSVVITSIVTTVVVGVVAAIVTLLVSHKIAGPMYRFEKDIEEIAEGNLQKKIRIRDGDQFELVAENLNRMVESLSGKVKEGVADLERLEEKALQERLPEEIVEEIRECRRGVVTRFKL